MTRTSTSLIAGLALLACMALRAQTVLKVQPSPNPEGSYPSVIQALEKAQLTDADGKKRNALHYLYGKQFIGLYFSAHWCGPCRAFTPELVKFRNYCHKKNLPFEVVFISSDKSKKDMRNYMRSMKMKWPAVPLDSDLGREIKKCFGVTGIPTLIILDWRGEAITHQGRSDVHVLGKDAYQKWQKASQAIQQAIQQESRQLQSRTQPQQSRPSGP